jgi:hypothetical protein
MGILHALITGHAEAFSMVASSCRPSTPAQGVHCLLLLYMQVWRLSAPCVVVLGPQLVAPVPAFLPEAHRCCRAHTHMHAYVPPS